MRENEKHITRVSSDEARRLKDETDYARLDALTDAAITATTALNPDDPPIDIDWDKASLVIPPGKDIVTLRLDRDVLDWLRAQGKGYQTLINKVLRAWYEVARKREKTAAHEASKQTRDREEVREAVVAAAAAAKKTAAKKAAAKRPAPAKKRA